MMIKGKDFNMTTKQILAMHKRMNNTSPAKLKKLLCGKLIGSGLYRDVYEIKGIPDLVVKIEREPDMCAFANATEWRNWCNMKDWRFISQWLAPCLLIDKSGQVLIQRRVTWEGKGRKDYPKQIPSLFTDLKVGNFGWIGDRFVCVDYAYLISAEPKMKNARWWGSVIALKQHELLNK